MAGNEHSGRKRLNRKKKAVQLRFEEEEYAQLAREAEAEMMSLAGYLRRMILKQPHAAH